MTTRTVDQLIWVLVYGGLLSLCLGLFLMAGALATIGLVVLQEARTERALSALRDLSQPHARLIRDAVERVRRWPVEPQRLGRRRPVDGKRRARQRGRAQRTLVEPTPRVRGTTREDRP